MPYNIEKFHIDFGKIIAAFTSLTLPITHVGSYFCSCILLPFLPWQFKRMPNKLLIPMCVFAGYWILRGIFAANINLAVSSALLIFSHWFFPYFIGQSSGKFWKTATSIYIIVLCMIILMGLISAIGLLPAEILKNRLWDEGMLWGFHHHNDFAAILILAFFISLGLPKKQSMIISPFLLLGFALTGSRGFFIAFIAAMPIIAYQLFKQYRIHRFFIYAGVIAALAAAFFIPSIRDRFAKSFSNDGSIRSRYTLWKVAGWSFAENPVFGIGPGQLVTRKDFVAKIRVGKMFLDAKSNSFSHLHNYYLTVLAEGGIVGLLLFLFLLFIIGRNLLRGSPAQRLFFIGFLTFAIGNLFDAQFRGPGGAMALFYMLGLLEIDAERIKEAN